MIGASSSAPPGSSKFFCCTRPPLKLISPCWARLNSHTSRTLDLRLDARGVDMVHWTFAISNVMSTSPVPNSRPNVWHSARRSSRCLAPRWVAPSDHLASLVETGLDPLHRNRVEEISCTRHRAATILPSGTGRSGSGFASRFCSASAIPSGRHFGLRHMGGDGIHQRR
jgi:hypothetical protein